jgi:hypothetical protein
MATMLLSDIPRAPIDHGGIGFHRKLETWSQNLRHEEVFSFSDDCSYGILQSDTHWRLFVECCSTLKGDFRYTGDTVYDFSPWPKSPITNAKLSSICRHASTRPADTPCHTAHRNGSQVISSLCRVTLSVTSEPFPGLLGSSPIPISSSLLAFASN